MKIFLPFHIPKLVKSLPFYIPEAWKRYPIRAEPPCLGHYREYPPGCFRMWKIWYIHLQQGHGCSQNRSQALGGHCPQSTQFSTTTPSGNAPSTSNIQLRDYKQERQGDVSYWHPQQSLPTLSACVCAEIEEMDYKASLPVSDTWWQIENASADDPVFQELQSIIQCG